MNLPNILTLLRIFLIPLVVLLFYLPGAIGHQLATLLFMIAGFTDWFDGFLARNLNQTTKLGAFLDPVADKLMIAIVLVLIVGEMHTAFIAIPAAIIVGREIVISALREWMAEIGKRTSVAVSIIGKIKTFTQMLAVTLLLLYWPGASKWILIYGVILLYVSAVMTLWSMYVYLKISWPDLTMTQK